MGAILHFFDLNQTGKSGKQLMHARHFEGPEAPRNSLELPLDASQSLFSKDESIPYSYQVKHPSTKNELCQSGTPMKLLIDREISKEPEIKQCVPSVVARLMGLDKFPTDSKLPTYEPNYGLGSGKATVTKELTVPREINHRKRDALFSRKKQKSHDSGTSSKLSKSLVGDHPQEQELQNFKKEFEAWQASKVWESSRGCGFDLRNGFWYDQRAIAQESLNKEKLARYTDAKRNRTYEKPPEIGYYTPSRLETSVQPETDFQGNKSSLYQGNQLETFSMWNGNRSIKYDRTHSVEYEEQQTSALPTKIVILKPGPERFDDCDESKSLSESAIEEEEEEGSIEDFLKEVKERLILGMRGNSVKHIKQQNNEISSFCGRPTNPKEIAQKIAKQVRESVTRDMSLLRSESMRSQNSDFQVGTPGSPELINRDARKFLSERLRNVLNGDTDINMHKMAKEGPRTSIFQEGPLPIGPDFSEATKNVGHLNRMQDMAGLKARSFRHDLKNEIKFNHDDLSPRNLIRSMSAPVSGAAFGKLLLEDQPILTGAHIRRKQEMVDNVSTELRKKKKSRFNFKGTVSSLRYSLTLRGKLFSKRIQSVERGVDEFGLTKTALTLTIPSLNRNLNVQENSTEVPPSPASACSDGQEGLFSGLTNHTSPVSTLDVPFSEDLSVSDAFQEISSNLQDLKQQIDQLGVNETDVASQDGREEDIIQLEAEEELEGGPEVYLRDVLGAAGIFEGLDGIVSMWDSNSAPIRRWVFEDVEEAYRKKGKQRQGSIQDPSNSSLERKLLFDLLNEALESKLSLLGSDVTLSKSLVGSTMMLPSSKQLIDDVCATVNMSTHPSFMGNETIQGITIKDFETTLWMRMMQGDVHSMGRDMEKIILNELVEEAVIEFCC
ncbi:uncharacterized protein LOC116248242 [Nymphaea colorata]|nr:uncharacterized protein LOC116248242 [Nymphaea colorata]